ncbi:MAG TPA: hypothetical protein VEY50_06030 [Lysobacter sp.]|nr:hypothetical protein [Lysobacter sp.]
MNNNASLRCGNAARWLAPTVLAACILAAPAFAQTASTVNPNHGSIVVKKFYDANANGVRDAYEPWLSNWPMTLTGNGSSSTKPTTATWSGLPGGPGYSVQEAMPVETNWVQTAPRVNGTPVNPYTLTVIPCKTTVVKFGNYCTKGSGGRTPGYWTNQNGEARMNDGGTMAPELGLLSSLNLVDASGNAFDPLDYASFEAWLRARNATNMAYQLSGHLAAMTLNVESGLVNGDATFLPCNCTINELMEDANESLGTNPYTPEGHPERANQETLKNWLDALNNGAQIVSPTPCKRTFATT